MADVALTAVSLPSWPIETVRKLSGQCHVWVAGGAVRDLVLDRTPADWDFVTDQGALSLARDVADHTSGAFYPLDAARGIGRAIVQDPRGAGTIALDFADLRAPSLEADLHLRDFTVNALAATLDGELYDPTGGLADIAARVIRVTGPDAFRLDPVRLVRAVRQSVELGFAIAPETRREMVQASASVAGVAAERVRVELVKLLRMPRGPRGFWELAQQGILEHVLPELDGPLANSEGPPATLRARAALELADLSMATDPRPLAVDPDAAAALAAVIGATSELLAIYWETPVDAEVTRRDLLAWSALLMGAGAGTLDCAARKLSPALCTASADTAERVLTRLRFSRAATGFVARTIRESWRLQPLSELATARTLHRYFRETKEAGISAAWLALAAAGQPTDTVDSAGLVRRRIAAAGAVAEAYLLRRDTTVAPAALISGRDLIALEVKPGPLVGRLLKDVREAQAAGEVHTRADALAWVRRKLATGGAVCGRSGG